MFTVYCLYDHVCRLRWFYLFYLSHLCTPGQLERNVNTGQNMLTQTPALTWRAVHTYRFKTLTARPITIILIPAKNNWLLQTLASSENCPVRAECVNAHTLRATDSREARYCQFCMCELAVNVCPKRICIILLLESCFRTERHQQILIFINKNYFIFILPTSNSPLMIS